MPTAPTSAHVAMVTPRFVPDLGGVENHVWEVARRLPDHGVRVTVLTTGTERGLPSRTSLDGVDVLRTRAYLRQTDLRVAPGILRLVHAGDYDLVHVQSYHTLVAPLGMLAAAAVGRPFVVTFHGGGHSSRVRTRMRPLQLAMLAPLLRRARVLVALARFEVDLYGRALRVAPERFVYIPNGADLPLASRSTPASDLIVSIGRLERYKGHHRVIQALPTILAVRPQARLWVVGDGPYGPELRGLAERLGVHEQVEIRGIPATERERFAEEVSRASVAAFMSEFETHPIAALEAAALGVRLVVADGSGLGEVAEAGLARAVPLGAEAAEIAEAIVAALDDGPPTIRPSLPTWDDCAARLAAVYRTLVAPLP